MAKHPLQLELPEALWRFVQEQSVARGSAGPEGFVQDLVRDACHREAEAKLEKRVIEAIQEDPVELSDSEWADLEAQIRRSRKRPA